jgi:hypothetical protein
MKQSLCERWKQRAETEAGKQTSKGGRQRLQAQQHSGPHGCRLSKDPQGQERLPRRASMYLWETKEHLAVAIRWATQVDRPPPSPNSPVP